VAEKLKRNAEGDYSPDQKAERFPEWQRDPTNTPKGAITISDLLAGWEVEARAKDKSSKTVKEYTSIIRRLIAFLGHDDAARVADYDLLRWKDHRLAEGKSLKTIAHSDFACFKAVFGWGRDNRRIPTNPAKEIKIKLGRKAQEREEQGFDAQEARAILSAALSYHRARGEFAETACAKHWVPWLCAYTGARVGEMVQLRKQDIRREGTNWVVIITPEAGRVKNKRTRVVVLHRHLVELGFVEFVHSAKGPYLFLTARNKQEALGRIVAVKNRLAQFARAIINDKRVAPNHGWRHRFVSVARASEIEDSVIYAITGHAPPNVGGAYGDVSIEGKAKAMAKFPRYTIDGAETVETVAE
jgi:integrase